MKVEPLKKIMIREASGRDKVGPTPKRSVQRAKRKVKNPANWGQL